MKLLRAMETLLPPDCGTEGSCPGNFRWNGTRKGCNALVCLFGYAVAVDEFVGLRTVLLGLRLSRTYGKNGISE